MHGDPELRTSSHREGFGHERCSIIASFAERLIGIARALYAEEPFGIDLAETVYALDATTIDLCLSVFPWAPFRSTKAAIKMHALLDLRSNIPASSISPLAVIPASAFGKMNSDR
jgi:hypothetical protein